jgi:plastocyanin
MKKIKLFLFFLISGSHLTHSTTWNIGISGFAFNPASITITIGDEVNFMINNSTHNAVEVSQATYNANGTSALAGGFSFPVGSGGLVPQAKLTLGTHYYVCTPHVASFSMKGTITVLSSGCTLPAKPPPITGNTSVCSNTLNTYSTTSVAGATSYTWTLPIGWIGNSTTNSINVTSGTSSGNITVTANSSCGNSDPTILAISTSLPPAQPGAITGNNSICINSINVYSIASVAGATSYTWTLPAGWSGSSTSTSITATAGSGSGNVSVSANNSCGASITRSLSVINSGPPAQPGNISGNSAVCPNTSYIYSISAVAGATSYTWTLPSGWSGNSSSNSISAITGISGGNISVVANGICGISISRVLTISTVPIPTQPGNVTGNSSVCANSVNNYSVPAVAGSSSYTWTLPAGWSGSSMTNTITVTVGSNGGNISVTANNSCGSSSASTLSVTTVGAIGQPGAIAGNTSVCMNSNNTYSINPVNGATSYSWTLPIGWIGTSTSNSITTTAGSAGGNITVRANSGCGQSPAQSLTVSTMNLPSQPSAISGNAAICENSSNIYSVIAIAGVTYNWSLPAGWSGSSTTDSITILAGSSSGNITVSASNGCGTSAPQTKTVAINKVPVPPTDITG